MPWRLLGLQVPAVLPEVGCEGAAFRDEPGVSAERSSGRACKVPRRLVLVLGPWGTGEGVKAGKGHALICAKQNSSGRGVGDKPQEGKSRNNPKKSYEV